MKGCGDILVQTKKGTRRISNVFYIPGLKHNLLSVGQLFRNGYQVNFKDDVCEIRNRNDALVGKVRMTQNKMFPLKFNDGVSSCLNMSFKDKSCYVISIMVI